MAISQIFAADRIARSRMGAGNTGVAADLYETLVPVVPAVPGKSIMIAQRANLATILSVSGRRSSRVGRPTQKAKKRVLPRAARKCIRTFSETYRATTGRECRSSGLFQHPVRGSTAGIGDTVVAVKKVVPALSQGRPNLSRDALTRRKPC
jgi:hypothetical protein